MLAGPVFKLCLETPVTRIDILVLFTATSSINPNLYYTYYTLRNSVLLPDSGSQSKKHPVAPIDMNLIYPIS